MRVAQVVVLALASAVFGCRDLATPEAREGANGTAAYASELALLSPSLTVDGPRLKLAVVTRFELEARDTNGIESLELRCGNQIATSWKNASHSAPEGDLYAADVNLGTCRTAGDIEGGVSSFDLRLVAFDFTDVRTELGPFPVAVDFASDPSPVFTLEGLAPRALPRRAISFNAVSSLPLVEPPTVTLDGTLAEVAFAADGNPQRFTVTALTPALANEAVGAEEPSNAVLEETARDITVSVSGLSLGGNRGTLERQLRIERVAWERVLPGTIWSGPTGSRAPLGAPGAIDRPTAIPSGLVLPMSVTSLDGGEGWVPGFMSAEGGVFTARAGLLVQNKLHAIAIDRRGGTILEDTRGSQAPFVYLPAGGGELLPAEYTHDGGTLLRVGDGICRYRVSDWMSDCAARSGHEVLCGGASDQFKVVTATALDQAQPGPVAELSTGDALWALDLVQTSDAQGLPCRSDAVRHHILMTGDQLVSFTFPRSPMDAGFHMPIADGSLALYEREFDGGVSSARFFTDASASPVGYGPEPALAVTTRGEWVRWSSGTDLKIRLEATAPDGTTRNATFPGLYEDPGTRRGTLSLLTPDGAGNELFVLTRREPGSLFYSLLAVGADGRPKFVFHYPRAISFASAEPLLLGANDSAFLYLLDLDANVVTAIAR